MECPNDINGMIDAAKYADLALLLIDGSYGFEMVRRLFLISEFFIYFYLGMEIVLVSPHALDKSNKESKNKAATNGDPTISVFLNVG